MKYILTICTFILLFSCNEKENKISYDGAYINSVISDVIKLDGGEEIKMDADSVSKIFYLIRHAEKDTTIKEDPPLSEEGLNRATRLADLLRGTRVDAIYSTMFLRTLYTVDSLADIKAMKVLPYDNKMLKDLIDQLSTDDDMKAVLFVGHSNTIPAMTNTLAGKEVYNQVFSDEDYDNFVVVVHFKNGEKQAYPLRFK